MTRLYTSYGITLFSALIVYWLFALFSSVAAGVESIPFYGFIASTLHFGLSSWLFLHFHKTGRVIAILTGCVMCILPIAAIIGGAHNESIFLFVAFTTPVILTVLLIYNHVLTYNQDPQLGKRIRIGLSLIPMGLFTAYIIYIISLFRSGTLAFT